jgi:hypothetical protein
MKMWTRWVVGFALAGAFLFAFSAHAQESQTLSPASGVDTEQGSAQNEALAESIIAREEAAVRRTFAPSFRAQAKGILASLSPAALEARAPQSGIGIKAPGNTQSDLVYVPIAPCRIINTLSAGGTMAAGSTRSFLVAASNLSSQGGSSTGCGVPFGPATAAVINFVAVNPAGAGDLRQTPFGTPVPLASFLNYVNSGIANDNTANGSVVTMCDPAAVSCASDFTVQVDASATDLVADVQGYFENLPTTFQRASATFVSIPGPQVQLTSITFTPTFTGSVLARARGYCNVSSTAASNEIDIAIGTTAANAFSHSVADWGVMRVGATTTFTGAPMYSAQSVFATTRGTAMTIGAFGASNGFTSAPNCSVELVIQGVF